MTIGAEMIYQKWFWLLVFLTNLIILFPPPVLLLAGLSGVVLAISFVYWASLALLRPIPSIPIIPNMNNSIFGYVDFYSSKNIFKLLDCTEKIGDILQFKLFGRNVVLINDPVVVKSIFQNIHGKGFFHNGGGVQPKNIFNLDTNEEWKLRRSILKTAFSMNNVSKFGSIIKAKSSEMCSILKESANSAEVVQIDLLFGKLVLDIICKVAFDFELDALSNSTMFQGLYNSTQTLLQPNYLDLIPGAKIVHALDTYSKCAAHQRSSQCAPRN